MPTYFVTVDGEEHKVELTEQREGIYQATLDEQTRQVDARAASGAVLSLLIDGVSYDADIERVKVKADDELAHHLNVRVHSAVIPVEVLDGRSRALRDIAGSAGATSGRQEIVAPMPGKVVKVLVEVGAEVEAGQGLVVVEAMKMENELQSPLAGKVVEIKAETGTTVDGGTVLIIVE